MAVRAVGQGEGGAPVAVAGQREQQGQAIMAQLQQLLPDTVLNLVDGDSVLPSGLHEADQVGQALLQDFGLENAVGVRHAHAGPPEQGVRGSCVGQQRSCSEKLAPGGPFGYPP